MIILIWLIVLRQIIDRHIKKCFNCYKSIMWLTAHTTSSRFHLFPDTTSTFSHSLFAFSFFSQFPDGGFRSLSLSLGVCANLEMVALNESCNGTLTYAMYYSYIARFIDLFCELLSFTQWKRYRVVTVGSVEFAQRANVDQCSTVTRRKERIRNRTKSRLIIVYGGLTFDRRNYLCTFVSTRTQWR